ncbi:Secretory pathway Sec39 [Drechmeria coniospora]|uniref:Secretory pathway Sec39 n=1 Tax=Drechmeria coniospora TaxID=98403 RepID=A0A151GRI5_DRECN|nr:Secretory pathway Sec39 [Drechmeria coniospora]KYK59725.1 Secretory pathway Sec39 [Drechmeria coniospora]
MCTKLSPAKVLLLAVHLAAHADLDGFSLLSSLHPAVLRKDVLLRILLTHLPETVRPASYVSFLLDIAAGDLEQPDATVELDLSPISTMSDHQASQKAKKLRLVQLGCPSTSFQGESDALELFLFQRARSMDQETGMLSQLPDLLIPFVNHSPRLRTWIIATVLPFVRRNSEYYIETAPAYSLVEFESLSDQEAVRHLLSRTADDEQAESSRITRDLRGLVGPWLFDPQRWTGGREEISVACSGWSEVIDWLTAQATSSYDPILKAFEQWDGPGDIDFGAGIQDTSLALPEYKQRFLLQSYARAVLASAYLARDATETSLSGHYRISVKIRTLLGCGEGDLRLDEALFVLPEMFVTEELPPSFVEARTASYLRSGLLQPQNPLTSATASATSLLVALVLSALISTRLGAPCTIKRACGLVFSQDEKEQRGEFGKLLHAISNNAPKDDDEYWVEARRAVLWLRRWGYPAKSSKPHVGGILSTVSIDHVESEMLKVLLAKSKYALARSLYEDGAEKPIGPEMIHEAVFQAALNAYDNASNPNRNRGGLKRCNDVLHSFPKTVDMSLPGAQRIQALLKATHGLSEYRLVFKQGEPFSPVLLRIHSDPLTVIDKLLQQNPKAYTRLQEFLEMGISMVRAGLPSRSGSGQARSSHGPDQDADMLIAERRITSMCVEAALREDDFETAYSYVISRLRTSRHEEAEESSDEWSWQAALSAGQYVRTERSQLPTHLGTARGNLEVRHLEQRIECLATALRVAPTCQLQEILKSFRRCEEQLDSAIKEEAANEAMWDSTGGLSDVPGAFDVPVPGDRYPPRNLTATATARQAEEAPMSLFDLSRATARLAQRNFTATPGLPSMVEEAPAGSNGDESVNEPTHERVRKRDQLREAATGTLVSSVGWLIGANINQGQTETR